MIRYPHCADRLDDAVAVVTGSTQGIGLGIARRFAAEGATVVVNDHGANDGDAVAAAVREEGGDALYVQADVSDPEGIEGFVETVVDECGRIDVLVNNVADFRHGPLAETSLQDWEDVMTVALRSHWLMTKAALPHMPDGASVINMSSVHAVQTDPKCIPYNVAKSGVNGLTRALAVELGPEGVRVNAIMPGKILVERLADFDTETATLADYEQETPIDPVGRFGTPADIAGLAAYLASDESSFVTGACIPIDGGRTAVLRDHDHVEWRRQRD
ncbi:SDR family oxidoreductase [Haloarculaceae archaeon H-GB11]|nr:SDR family oxidoreductase [Haloarculaceae archaeon H-GB11]